MQGPINNCCIRGAVLMSRGVYLVGNELRIRANKKLKNTIEEGKNSKARTAAHDDLLGVDIRAPSSPDVHRRLFLFDKSNTEL
jgi:hypothetical protein